MYYEAIQLVLAVYLVSKVRAPILEGQRFESVLLHKNNNKLNVLKTKQNGRKKTNYAR